MASVKAASREAAGAIVALFGLGASAEEGPGSEHQRGAGFLTVQVAVVAAVATMLGLLRMAVGGPSAVAWVLSAFLLAVPVAMAVFAAPPRRVAGLIVGLCVGSLVGVGMVFAVPGGGYWWGFAALVAAFLTGSASFGWITTSASKGP